MSRFRVFISSTIEDLRDVRASVAEDLSATELFEPVRVEDLPASEEPSRIVCLREVARADAVVLILKNRYGFVPTTANPSGLSVTHLEYREAIRLERPIFAFLHEGVVPEQGLRELITEVSDFDAGVLRKTWRTASELKEAVRRALQFWVLRQARGATSKVAGRMAVSELDRDPTFGGFRVVLDLGGTDGTTQNKWIKVLLRQLKRDCKLRMLPIPRACHADEDAAQGAVVAGAGIRMSLRPAGRSGRVALTIQPIDTKDLLPSPIPLSLDVPLTEKGARFAARCSLALVLLTVDDWSACISQLCEVASLRFANTRARAQLLASAAWVSCMNLGQRSGDVVERILTLPRLPGPTVFAGGMALMSATRRLEHAGARRALRECEMLALTLVATALKQDPSCGENVYNMARQWMKHNPSVALAFFNQLLLVDLSYEERWYYHRDVGLIHYGAGNVEAAAESYDRACHLKNDDSELHRFAGDAYFYRGRWVDALLRYERAVTAEPTEVHFLDEKMAFCRGRFRLGLNEAKAFRPRRWISERLSRYADRVAVAGLRRLALPLLHMAVWVYPLNESAENWLALYANRRGDYLRAVDHLKRALAALPESPSTHLNIVINLVSLHDGRNDEESVKHARSAMFLGGPGTIDHLRLRLINTRNSDALLEEYHGIMESIRAEWDQRMVRRKEVLKPAMFGAVMHAEFRP